MNRKWKSPRWDIYRIRYAAGVLTLPLANSSRSSKHSPTLSLRKRLLFGGEERGTLHNQSQDSSVTDPFLDHLDEQASDDGVEVAGNVRFQNCRDRPTTHDPANLVQRVLWPTARPESVGTIQEILLIDRIEQIGRRFLHDLVFQRRYRDRPLPSVLFWNVDPPQRLRTILPVLQTIMELFQISLYFLGVSCVNHVLHARTGIFPQIFECLLQSFHRQKMSDR